MLENNDQDTENGSECDGHVYGAELIDRDYYKYFLEQQRIIDDKFNQILNLESINALNAVLTHYDLFKVNRMRFRAQHIIFLLESEHAIKEQMDMNEISWTTLPIVKSKAMYFWHLEKLKNKTPVFDKCYTDNRKFIHQLIDDEARLYEQLIQNDTEWSKMSKSKEEIIAMLTAWSNDL